MASSTISLKNIAQCKCPKCGKGYLFIDKNPYHLNDMAKMYKVCPNCGLRFEPEVGFYYGAMYLSYAIGVFSSLIVFAIFNFVFGINTTWSFIALATIWVGISPYLFRFSRSLWLSLYVNKHRDL